MVNALLITIGALAAAVVVLALDGRRAHRRVDRYRRMYRNARVELRELRARVNAEQRAEPALTPLVSEAQIDDTIAKILEGAP